MLPIVLCLALSVVLRESLCLMLYVVLNVVLCVVGLSSAVCSDMGSVVSSTVPSDVS